MTADICQLAHHEAGHAIVAQYHDCGPVHCRIWPKYGEWWGSCQVDAPIITAIQNERIALAGLMGHWLYEDPERPRWKLVRLLMDERLAHLPDVQQCRPNVTSAQVAESVAVVDEILADRHASWTSLADKLARSGAVSL